MSIVQEVFAFVIEPVVQLEAEFNSTVDIIIYFIMDDSDIEKVNKNSFDEDKRKANKIQAAITNALLPVQQKYNALNQEQRYQFRKFCRTFVKWHGYITQIARMFDK